jgi:hypothetical protein
MLVLGVLYKVKNMSHVGVISLRLFCWTDFLQTRYRRLSLKFVAKF